MTVLTLRMGCESCGYSKTFPLSRSEKMEHKLNGYLMKWCPECNKLRRFEREL